MPIEIVFPEIDIENAQTYKEPDTDPVELGLLLNYIGFNADGDRKRYNKKIDLTPQEKIQIANFLKPHVQKLGTDLGVIIPTWAQP